MRCTKSQVSLSCFNNTDFSNADVNANEDAAEICDGEDNNCDGTTDEGYPDQDGDGVAECVDPGGYVLRGAVFGDGYEIGEDEWSTIRGKLGVTRFVGTSQNSDYVLTPNLPKAN